MSKWPFAEKMFSTPAERQRLNGSFSLVPLETTKTKQNKQVKMRFEKNIRKQVFSCFNYRSLVRRLSRTICQNLKGLYPLIKHFQKSILKITCSGAQRCMHKDIHFFLICNGKTLGTI